jgi:hypothetical protein
VAARVADASGAEGKGDDGDAATDREWVGNATNAVVTS